MYTTQVSPSFNLMPMALALMLGMIVIALVSAWVKPWLIRRGLGRWVPGIVLGAFGITAVVGMLLLLGVFAGVHPLSRSSP